MKDSRFLLGTLPLIAYGVDAVAAYTQQDGILSFPLKASTGKSLGRRQNSVGVDTQLTGTLYTIDVTIGTPGMTVSLELSTGTDEMWVNPVCSKSFNPELCTAGGRFSSSQTFVDLGVQGGIQYPQGYAEFEYGYDYVAIGSVRLAQQIFGAAYDSEYRVFGNLGVAPSLSGWDSPYPLVLDNLLYQGFINSRAFSLDLRSVGTDDGAVIFGGIDTARYVGSLEKLSIVPAASSPDGYTRYWVSASGVAVSRAGNSGPVTIANAPITFHLNSGSTLSALPTAAFNGLLTAIPEAAAIQGSTLYAVPCSLADENGSVDFTFGSAVVNIPLRDFVWQQPDGCYLGAYKSDDYPILGATFLRAAYVVFDWDNRELHIANSVRNRAACDSNLVAIGNGRNAVPSIVGTCASTSSSSSAAASSTTDFSSTISSDSFSSTTDFSSASSTESFSSDSIASSTIETSSDAASSSELPSSTLSSDISASSTESSSSASSTESSDFVSTSTEFSSTATSSDVSSSISETSSDVSSITSQAESSSAYSSDISASSTATSSEYIDDEPCESEPPTEYPSETPTGTDSSITSLADSSSAYSSAATSSSSIDDEPCESETEAEYPSEIPSIYITPSASPSPYPTITHPPLDTSTVTATTTYTVTSCAEYVPYCTVGAVTTEVVTRYTTFCPETTATYTLPATYACNRKTCQPGQATEPHVFTVVPGPTRSAAVEIPGCSEEAAAYTSPGYEAPVPTSVHGPGHVTYAPPAATHGHLPVYTSILTSITPANASTTKSGDEATVTAGASINGVSALVGLGVGIMVAILA